MDVVSKMYKGEGGVKAFLSGSSARVMWLLPFTVIHLGVYEGTCECVCVLMRVRGIVGGWMEPRVRLSVSTAHVTSGCWLLLVLGDSPACTQQ